MPPEASEPYPCLVRIISGTHKGRKLLPPATDATRPVTDRIKTRLFDRLQAAGRLEAAHVLDVFSGTGSFGLEALSRGASHATFFEKDRSALDRLRRNITACAFDAASTVVDGDLFDFFAKRTLPVPADVVFFDPPYRMVNADADRLRRLLTAILRQTTPGGMILFRHDAADTPDLTDLPEAGRWEYGSMTVTYLEKP